jgi:hypothetical protein
MGALLVTFLPRNPQYVIQWGGDPTLLALALLVIAAGFLPRFREAMAPGTWALCGLMVAASMFTHLIPAIGFLYSAIPVAVYGGIYGISRRRGEMRYLIRNMLGVGLISGLLFSVGFSSLLSTEVSAAEIEWVLRFQREWSGGAWGGSLGNALITIPYYLLDKIFGGFFLGLGCLGLLTLALRRPYLAIASALWSATVVGLIINSMYWILPLSYAMYPERVALLLLLPFALGIGALLDGLRHRWPKQEVIMWVMVALVLFIAVRENERLLYKGLIPNSLLTKADLLAMRWIRGHTNPGALFHNRYGDAGLWIPAIAFRPITDPHLNPFYFDEFRTASSGLKAQYIYVGKRKVLGEPISVVEFESAPNRYRKVYDQDSVIIYEVVNQTANEAD